MGAEEDGDLRSMVALLLRAPPPCLAPRAVPSAAYCPRRPDLADVACGFTAGGGACRAGLPPGCCTCGCPPWCPADIWVGWREKSGMSRADFFFIGAP